MEDVIFDEEPPVTRNIIHKPKKQPLFYRLVIIAGWAKDEKEAEKILIGVSVTAFLLMLGFLTVAIDPPHSQVPQSIVNADNAKLQNGGQ